MTRASTIRTNDMRTDEQVNTAAVSFGTSPRSADSSGNGGLPAIQVAGTTVWLYRKHGRMVISVDTDDTIGNEDAPVYNFGGDDLVAMTITVNGQIVYEGDPTEDDLRAMRKVGLL